MGPRRSYNYGTFVAPAGCCVEEVHREGGGTENLYQGQSAPAFSATHRLQFRISRQDDGRFGLRLTRDGTEVVISEVDDDVARVRIGLVLYFSQETCCLILLLACTTRGALHLSTFCPEVSCMLLLSPNCRRNFCAYVLVL